MTNYSKIEVRQLKEIRHVVDQRRQDIARMLNQSKSYYGDGYEYQGILGHGLTTRSYWYPRDSRLAAH